MCNRNMYCCCNLTRLMHGVAHHFDTLKCQDGLNVLSETHMLPYSRMLEQLAVMIGCFAY